MKHALALCGLVCLAPSALASAPAARSATEDEKRLLVDKDWLELVPWRSIGPANMGGRITAIAVSEQDASLFWIATASGGLLKSTNGGISYEHQFDRESTVSIGALDVAPSDPQIVWVGTGEENPRNSVSYGDGVYKSTDGGTTWKRMGLAESFQIGAIEIHPQNPDVVYVGALGRLYGPNEERGVFKTTDGGKSWSKVLYIDDRTGVVDIDMSPADPETLLVATYERERDGFDTNDPSKKWGPGSGIHKTTDGGASWKKLTSGLPTVQMGRIGIDYYRADPTHVYAVIETERIARLPDDAAWAGFSGEDAEVGAKLTKIEEGGPAESATLQKDDIVLGVGEERILSWNELVRALREHKSGDTVTLEIARAREPMVVELTLASMPEEEAERSPFSSGLGGQRENLQGEQGRGSIETGGVFRSTDGGETWQRINSLNPRPMYFSEVRVDPSDEKHVYVLGIALYRSQDGGATFTADGAGDDVHVDHHALWIDPRDGRHMLLGGDGGIYETRDRMARWDHHAHVSIGQFYHATVDSRELYNVYGGLQDNGSWGGPNRTREGDGPVNEDWFRVGGGDGFVCRVDPEDPDLVYFESQNGGIGRWNLKSGERAFMRPRGQEGTRYRFNWETPFVLSSHHPRVFYSAGNFVFRSPDKGDDLEPISPEITLTDRGSATALEESPKDAKVLYVGTDDGALWTTRDGGASWIDLFDPWAHEVEADHAERRKRALALLVGRLDANADGRIEKSEVPGDLTAFFATADLDESGALEEAEMRKLSGTEPPPETAPEPAAPADDPVTGTWKGRLTSPDAPAESSRFQLELALKQDGSISGRFETATKKGELASGKYELATKAIELAYELEVGLVRQTGTLEGGKMSGLLEAGEGLIRVGYEAEREGGPAAGTPAAIGEPWGGEWKARIVGESAPAEPQSFTIELRAGKGGRIEGRVTAPIATGEVREASFDAEQRALAFEVLAGGSPVRFQATLEAERMKGSFASGLFTMQFEAERAAPAPPPASSAGEPAQELAERTEAPAEEEEGATGEKKPRKKKREPERTLAKLLPQRMWVSSIEASRHDASRVYAVFDGHRSNDDRPYVFVSEDRGDTWTALSAKLPRGSSRVLREDRDNQDVLYLGTEFTAWISFDRGSSWQRMGGRLPTVAVHDFAQHPTNADVVVATHGRSLWIFDATLLRQVTSESASADAHLFRPAKLVRWSSLPSRGASGTRRFVGEHPGDGIRIYYSLGKKPEKLRLFVEGLGGETIRELEAETKRGIHCVTWDGRRDGRETERGRRPGPRVPAGRYLAVLESEGRRLTQEIVIEDDPEVAASSGFGAEEE